MNRFNLTTDIVYSKKVLKDITIVHISDIHFSLNTKSSYLDRLVTYTKKLNPDYIMITGDTIDNPSIIKDKKIKELIAFLTKLGKISKVFISLGNHDIISNDDYAFFEDIDYINNIYVLNNKRYLDDYICVMGLTLPSNYYYNLSKKESPDILYSFISNEYKYFYHITKKIPIITLIHSPICLTDERILELISRSDLVLCGHTHRGMVPKWLDFLFRKNTGIIAPNKNLFPKIAKGKIEKEVNNKTITIIINGAITKLSRQAGKFFSSLNFLWNGDVNKIIITKKEGRK